MTQIAHTYKDIKSFLHQNIQAEKTFEMSYDMTCFHSQIFWNVSYPPQKELRMRFSNTILKPLVVWQNFKYDKFFQDRKFYTGQLYVYLRTKCSLQTNDFKIKKWEIYGPFLILLEPMLLVALDKSFIFLRSTKKNQ